MRLLIKIGGAVIETTAGRARLAASIAVAHEAGHELLVVHGGGKQIGAVAARLGLPERRHEGLRITDAETARVVAWVLAGEINKTLVCALGDAGLAAAGMTGADLGFFTPHRKRASVDLGFVGALDPADVDTNAVEPLLANGIVPVIATLGPERSKAAGPLLNVNADEAAGPIAAACRADALIALSDVEGVLDRQGALIPKLRATDIESMIAQGVVTGGMIPKLRSALAAVRAGVPRICISAGDRDEPIAAALEGSGTEILT